MEVFMNFKKLLLLSVSILMPISITSAPNQKVRLALQVKQLHTAIKKGDIKQVRKYARLYRNNLSIKNNAGLTALQIAEKMKQLPIKNYLVARLALQNRKKNEEPRPEKKPVA